MSVKPKVKAILVCDYSLREEGTGKVSLVGLFSNIQASQFPCRHPALNVYAQLTDAEGPYQFRLELVHLETDRVVSSSETNTVQVASRLGVGELSFRLQNLEFEQPGKYTFRLYANDAFLEEADFFVVERSPGDTAREL